MASIDFSLREAQYDVFTLLPEFYQELDASVGNGGARMLTDAWNQQWFELYDLINGVVSPAHDSWYAGPNTLPYIANLLNAPDLTAFNAESQNFLVWCWPAIRGEKGVTRSVVALAGLLGYKVNVFPLWSAFALPNPTNLADSSNDPYLSYTPQIPLATDGILNQEAANIRQQNGIWILNQMLYGGELTIQLLNNPAFTQPTVGFTLFFPNDLTVYTVADSTLDTVTLDQPLKVPTQPITPGASIPIFNPVIVYPASFFDLGVVVDPDILDPTDIVTAFSGKLKILKDKVIPFRDRLRQVLSSYVATASYTATCQQGLYGNPYTATATYTSQLSYDDALTNAQAQAYYNALSAIQCVGIPPEMEITGIEPLAFTQFYATATFTAQCPAGYYGAPSTVTVTRTSSTSQSEADQLAFAAAVGLANASLSCTLNVPPLISIVGTSPTYSATATYTAACTFGELGSPVTVTKTYVSSLSYQDALSQALSAATAEANAELVCTAVGAPQIEFNQFVYTIEVGVTATEICPSGQQGSPATIAQIYSFTSREDFQPTFQDAVTLATAQAADVAQARLICTSDAGPTITISSPTTTYSATATVTESCVSGLNYQTGNVITATYTDVDPTSYANAALAAGSGATAAAFAALNCSTPTFTSDSIMLVAKDEFGYAPTLRYDGNSLPYNSGNDYYYNGVSLGSARSDFTRFLQTDAPALQAKGVKQVIVEVSWFTPLTNKALLQPYMSADFATRNAAGSGNANWSVGTFNPGNASTLPTPGCYRGGTSNDASLIAAIQSLSNAGFKVGINPVVRWIDVVNSVLADRSTIGYDSAGDITNFPTWLSAYNSFLQHYVSVFQSAGVTPSIFYLGNGYRALTNDTNTTQRNLFIQQMLASSATIKSAFPSTTLTYAARHDEYGWNPTLQDFPLDDFWNSPNITFGVNWYEPSSIIEPVTWNTAQVGANAGEDMYYTYSSLSDSNRLLNTTDHAGKTNAVQSAIYPGIGSKNLQAYLSTNNWHYVPPPSGYAAGATALPGNSFRDTNGFSGLTLHATGGTAFLESRFNWFSPRSYGTLPRPTSEWLTALNVGSGGYATTQMPAAVTAGTYTSTTIEIDFKPDFGGNPPLSGVIGIVSVPDGGFSIQWNGGYRQVFTSIVMSSGPNFVTAGVFADDDTITQYHVSYYLSGGSWYVTEGYYQGGTLVANTVPLGGTPFLSSSTGTVYVGAYSSTSSVFTGSIYKLYLSAFNTSAPPNYGGTFYFDEAYGGTRTSYIAENVPAMCTELGCPSVDGGAVEPIFDPTPVPVNVATEYLGDNTLRTSPDNGKSGLLLAQSCTLAAGGVLQSFSIYFGTVSGTVELALYDATGTGNGPGNLRTSVAAFTPTVGWNTVNVTKIFIPAGNYWLAYEASSNTTALRAQTTSGTYVYVSRSYGAFPSTFPTGWTSNTGGWSFYATVNSGAVIVLPTWLDAGEQVFLNSVISTGYTFSDFHGPYGDSFKRNFLHQLYAVTANLNAVKSAGIIQNTVITEWDVRTPQAFSALSAGHYVYADGPLWAYRRVLNGKLLMGI